MADKLQARTHARIVLPVMTVLAAFGYTKSARADDYLKWTDTGPVCHLPFSPWSHETATPSDLICELDQDHDDISDEIEGRLAECFVPMLVFDSAENSRMVNPKFPGGIDPVALFSVYRIPGTDDDPSLPAPRVRMHFDFRYDNDSGFYKVIRDHNNHRGDVTGIDMEVELTSGIGGWVGELVSVRSGGQWRRGQPGLDYARWVTEPKDVPSKYDWWKLTVTDIEATTSEAIGPYESVWTSGTHPVVFLSAGKHHDTLRPYPIFQYGECWATSLFTFGAPVTIYEYLDRSDGTGAKFTPPIKSHREPVGAPPSDYYHNVGLVSAQVQGQADRQQAWDHYNDARIAYDGLCACTPQGMDGCVPQLTEEQCQALRAVRDSYHAAYSSLPVSGVVTVNQNRCLAGLDKAHGGLGIQASGWFVSDHDMKDLWGWGSGLTDFGTFCGVDPAGSCGGESPSAVWTVVALPESAGAPIDTDGDTVPNRDDNCPVNGNVSQLDSDFDGVGDACEQTGHKVTRDTWVGAGALVPKPYQVPYTPSLGWDADPHRAGWLDTDRDHVPNGEDMCPDMRSGSTDQRSNINEWGESTDFDSPPDSSFYYPWLEERTEWDPPNPHNAYRPDATYLGFVHRGDICDPYETAYVRQYDADYGQTPSDCQPISSVGSSFVRLDVQTSMGVSVNDTHLTGTADDRWWYVKQQEKPVFVEVRRCGCATWDTNPADCFNADYGACPKVAPLQQKETMPGTPNGRGWLPVQSDGCAIRSSTDEMPGYCDRIATTAKVGVPDVCDEGSDACDKAPGDTPWLDVQALHWDWANEPLSHFPDGWFEEKPGQIIPSETYRKATVGFTTASWVYHNKVTAKIYPHVAEPFARLPGQQADIRPDWQGGTWHGKSQHEHWADRTNALRTFFTDKWIVPASEHTSVHDIPGSCLPVVIWPWDAYRWLPDPPDLRDRISWAVRPDGWAILQNRADPSDGLLVDSASGTVFGLYALAASTAERPLLLPTLMTKLGGDGEVPMQTLSLSTSGLSLTTLRTSNGGRDAPPAILAIAPSPFSGAQYSIATPVAGQPPGTYDIAAHGLAPAGALSKWLFSDGDAGFAVAVEETADTTKLHKLNLETGTWSTTEVALVPRQGATYAYHRYIVYRAGGIGSEGTDGDVVAIQAVNGQTTALAGVGAKPFPARNNPSLSWDVDDDGLVLAGGQDGAGWHDDVWSLRRGMSQAVRIVADSPAGRIRPIDSAIPVYGSGQFASASLLGPSTAGGALLSLRRGGPTGWSEIDLVTGESAPVAQCAGGITPYACAPTSDWWRGIGETCALGDTCVAADRENSAQVATLSTGGVKAFALDGTTLWLGAGQKVERWEKKLSGAWEKRQVIQVAAKVHDLQARSGLVGVATKDGFQRIGRVNGVWTLLEAPVELCGTPLHAVALENGRWFVMTSMSAALLGSTDDDTLVVKSMGMTVPASAGEWRFEPVVSKPEEKQICRVLDKALCGILGCQEIPSAATQSGPGEVLGARAVSLVRFAIDGEGAISVRDGIALDTPVDALRLYRNRAYAVGRSWCGDRRDVVDLGSSLELVGQHDVSPWVTRQDSGATRVRLRNNHIDLAQVAP